MSEHVIKPGWFTINVFNRTVAWLTRRGLSVWGSRVLAVRGRKSGEWRRTPVNLLVVNGERYLVACVKLGEKGAVMSFDGTLIEETVEPIAEVDATGAGDAFDGVLLAALARGEQPEAALRRACHAGALVASSADTWPSKASL